MDKIRMTIEADASLEPEIKAALTAVIEDLDRMDVHQFRQHKTDTETARLVYGLYKSGLAVRDISRRTSVSRSTVSKIAADPSEYGLRYKPLRRQGISEGA